MDKKPLLPTPEAQNVSKWVKPELMVISAVNNTLGSLGVADDGAGSS